ncbi:MAG: N-acetylmuramoyl-L-alanine amidase [Candidatus Eremiobacteraeota bacterium]|nr:N-acetylmuramoyl-L-alanine amidase [Candidatus Eremiobacteraeota bacterium]
MSLIDRLNVRTGSAFALLALAMLWPAGASAAVPSFWFFGSSLNFQHIEANKDDFGVPLSDPALQNLLSRMGASIAWQSGQRYILITAADHRVISFTLGDTRFNAGPVFTTASFAPYSSHGDVYLPLEALARSLNLAPLKEANEIVLQPQLALLDVRSDHEKTNVAFRGAVVSSPRVRTESDRLVLEFPGLGSALESSRKLGSAGVSQIDVAVSGTVRNPTTTVVIFHSRNVAVQRVPADPSEVQYAFSMTPEVAMPRAQSASPPSPVPRATASPQSQATGFSIGTASISSVDVTPNGSGITVRLAIAGNANYEWHRLPRPDTRWYLDVKGTILASAPRDEREDTDAVKSLRVRQLASAPPTVRVALTLAGRNRVDIVPFAGGLTLNVPGDEVNDMSRSGVGIIGSGARAYAPPVAVALPAEASPAVKSSPYVGANPRLIVIDPGHGGSDSGAFNATTIEKNLNLDISERLRSLLVARGWTVKMTRRTDVDVYAPNDSARDELQARCDIANAAGARMFISVHTNSYTNSSPSGTTTYYYKAQDLPLAAAIHHRLLPLLGTKDDGVIKNRFYVIAHTNMPAALIETAFLSNPNDAELLRSADFLQRIALGIADGVRDYAGSPAGVLRPGR